MVKKLRNLALLWCFCFCTGCTVNPITGEKQFILLPEEQDVEIGQKYAPEIEKQMGGRIADLDLQNYIDNVGQKCARVSHKPYFDYHFVALEDESINAFALPGGYIFITRGMLKKLRTEAQLASVLAHEITHVVARHSAEVMSREIGINILLSAVTSEDTPGAVLTVADLGQQILGLSFSREHERQADLGGLEYMTRAGYAPYGMVETMQMLEAEQKVRPIEFFSTHPSPENRLEYITGAIHTNSYSTTGLRVGKEDYERAVLNELK